MHKYAARLAVRSADIPRQQQPYRTPGRRPAHTVAVFAQASVGRASACGLVELFGSRDDAAIVQLADLGGRQSQDVSEDFVGVFAEQRRWPRGRPGQIAQCDR